MYCYVSRLRRFTRNDTIHVPIEEMIGHFHGSLTNIRIEFYLCELRFRLEPLDFFILLCLFRYSVCFFIAKEWREFQCLVPRWSKCWFLEISRDFIQNWIILTLLILRENSHAQLTWHETLPKKWGSHLEGLSKQWVPCEVWQHIPIIVLII